MAGVPNISRLALPIDGVAYKAEVPWLTSGFSQCLDGLSWHRHKMTPGACRATLTSSAVRKWLGEECCNALRLATGGCSVSYSVPGAKQTIDHWDAGKWKTRLFVHFTHGRFQFAGFPEVLTWTPFTVVSWNGRVLKEPTSQKGAGPPRHRSLRNEKESRLFVCLDSNAPEDEAIRAICSVPKPGTRATATPAELVSRCPSSRRIAKLPVNGKWKRGENTRFQKGNRTASA